MKRYLDFDQDQRNFKAFDSRLEFDDETFDDETLKRVLDGISSIIPQMLPGGTTRAIDFATGTDIYTFDFDFGSFKKYECQSQPCLHLWFDNSSIEIKRLVEFVESLFVPKQVTCTGCVEDSSTTLIFKFN